ncbi:hypothetical protein NQ318_016485, partial [Aromia moschata]
HLKRGKMEVDSVKEVFQRSEEMHNVKYAQYIGDGDSKTFKAILDLDPYNNDPKVMKKECVVFLKSFFFQICDNEILGRHLRATRDIKPGEIILQEPPLIWGPSQMTVPVCLGCGKAVNEKNSKPCFKCGWPVCNETCAKAPAHIPECRYTVSRGERQFLSEVWKKIDNLQSHCEERRGTQKYEQDRVTIAKFILKFFKLANVFTEEEILRVCGIVMAITLKTSKKYDLDVALLVVLEDEESEKILQETVHLIFLRKELIRAHTRYISDCNGYLLPKTFIENNNNEKGPDWDCNKCEKVVSAYTVQDLLERIGRDLSELPKGVSKDCKEFIETYERYLHRNHYYLTDVKLALSQIIGQEFDGGLPAASDDDLELKARLCQGLANLIKILTPGEKRARGLLLFELHAAVSEIGRRRGDLDTLLDAKNILTEASDLLKFEPDCIAEGQIYRQCQANLKQLDFLLTTMHNTLGVSPL